MGVNLMVQASRDGDFMGNLWNLKLGYNIIILYYIIYYICVYIYIDRYNQASKGLNWIFGDSTSVDVGLGPSSPCPIVGPGPSIRAWRKLVARGFVKRAEVEPLRRMGPARRWLLLQKVAHLVATEAQTTDLT